MPGPSLTLPEAVTYFCPQRRKEKGLAQPAFLQPPSPEDGLEKKCWTGSGGAFCCFFSFAHSPAKPLCPGLGGSVPTQAQSLPSPWSQRPPHPPLVRAEAIHDWVFCPFAPGVKHFSFSHFLSCLVRWQGSSLAEAYFYRVPRARGHF